MVKEAFDAGQRLHPHSSLIRQSSWSGLSESSSHESLTGPLVKSSSLNSMKTPAESSWSFSSSSSSTVALSLPLPLNFSLFFLQRLNCARRPSLEPPGPMAAAPPPSPINLQWGAETHPPRPLRRPLLVCWFVGVRSASPPSTRSVQSRLILSWTAASSEMAGWCL